VDILCLLVVRHRALFAFLRFVEDGYLDSFLDLIVCKATLKKALLFSALFAGFFALINFSSFGVAGLLRITGGASILDFEFGFSYEKAYEMLSLLGVDGRAFYISRIVPIDFPFPLSYMLFYVGWMALLLKRIKPIEWLKYLLFAPVLAMLLDWIENIGIISMLRGYPILPRLAVSFASTFGMFKMVFIAVNFLIIGVLLIVFVISSRKKHSHTDSGV